MRTTIYELLGMIKDGKAPKKIKFADEVLVYDVYTIDYVDSDGDGLFNEYTWITELNDEVEILDELKEIKYGLKPYKEYLNDLGISYEVNNANIEYLDRTSKIIIELIDELNKLKEK